MGGSRWTWRLLALPGVAWLSIFFLVALYAVVAVAFGNQDTLSNPSRSGIRWTGTSATCSRC